MRKGYYIFFFLIFLHFGKNAIAQELVNYTPTSGIESCISDAMHSERAEQLYQLKTCLTLSQEKGNINDFAFIIYKMQELLLYHTSEEEKLSDSINDITKKLLNNSQIDSLLLSQLNYNLGVYLTKETDYQKAIKYHLKSADIASRINEHNAIVQSYIQLLFIYFMMDDKDNLIRFYEKSNKILEHADDYWQGVYFLTISEFTSLLPVGNKISFLKKAEKLLNRSENQSKMTIVYLQLFEYHMVKSQYDSCHYYLRLVENNINSNSSSQNKLFKTHLLSAKGMLAISEGNYEEGLSLFKKAIEIAKIQKIEAQRLEYLKIASLIAEDHEDYKNAHSFLKEINSINDSLQSLERIKQYESLIVQYETDQKDLTIKSLEKEKDLQALLLREKERSNLLLVIGLVSSFLLSFIIVILYNQKRTDSKKLESLNLLKDKIFSALSHDLRSPLYSFNHLVELGRNQYISKEMFDEYLEELQSELKNTNNLINSLLRWAHSNREMLHIKTESINLSSTTDNVLDLYKGDLNRKKMKVIKDYEDNITVNSDIDLIQYIFRNIISNSIKFSKEEKELNVTIKKQSNETLVIIKDEGKGFSSKQIEDFYKGNLRSSKDEEGVKSIGLGLLITKDFAKKIKAKIDLESSDQGSVFTIRIPDIA